MTSSLRVLLTHPTAWPEVHRGAERYVHELGRALTTLGHDVTIATSAPRAWKGETLGVRVRATGRGPLGPVGLPSDRQCVLCAAAATLQALSCRHDVWHANGLYDAAAAVLASRGRPGMRTVLTAHGPAAPSSNRGLRRGVRSLALRCHRTIAVSEPAARQLHAVVGRRPTVVPPGVDTDVFHPGGTRAKQPVVLYVGTLLSPRKNVALLRDAVAAARKREPSLELWLAGGGEPGLGARDPWVRHLGVLEGAELVNAYRSSWLVALVSREEVFGMTVVEGLACGTPALVLDDGWGPSTLVTDDTGVRTAADAEAMSDAIVRGLALSAQASTKDACRTAGERFDWVRSVAPAVVQVYTS